MKSRNLAQISAKNSYNQTFYLPRNVHIFFVSKDSRQKSEIITYFPSVLLQGNDPSSWIFDFKRIKIFGFRFKKPELQQAENGGAQNHWQEDDKDPGFGHWVFQRITSCERLHFWKLLRGAWAGLECEGGAEIWDSQLRQERTSFSFFVPVAKQLLHITVPAGLLNSYVKYRDLSRETGEGGGKKWMKRVYPSPKDADCSV